MASLQARHSRTCAIARPWTTFADAQRGCTCPNGGPLYHIVTRVPGERALVREPVGHNRKVAQKALNRVRVEQDEGKYQPPKDITFSEWADKWKARLRRPGANTLRSYTSTLDYAKEAFGDKLVRKLGPADVDRFLTLMAKRSPATQRKHLRVLGSCLKMAVRRGYAARNPVDALEAEELPTIEKPTPSYFTDAELLKLWPALADESVPPVFLYLHKAALATGARQGELLELRWPDVHMLEGEIEVRRAYTPGIGVGVPKSRKGRTVDLTPEAQALFAEWYQLSGSPTEGALVFPAPAGGYLSGSTIRRGVLYEAMGRARIPRVGEGGRRRDFHSLRHTFARIALENGAPITWVKQQLGHSSITLTVDRYGRWERKAEKEQAAKLAGAFAL
jgi:integrase